MKSTTRKAQHLADFDAEKDHQQEMLIDVHGAFAEQHECEHTPDQLELRDTSFEGDRIINHFKCECGRELDEVFTLSRTQIIE